MLKYRVYIFLFAVGAALWVIATALALIKFWDITSPLIIQFDVFRGITILGSKSFIFKMLGIAAAFFLINIMLARVFIQRHIFLSYLIAACTGLVMLFMFASVVTLIHINL